MAARDEDDGDRNRRAVPPTMCVCPAASSSTAFSGARSGFDPGLPVSEGNATYGHRMMLYGRHGYHIAILPSGRIKGTNDEYNKYAMMQFSSAGVGEVRIQGLETSLYLAMNQDGKLYGEGDRANNNTIFIEAFLTQYNTYLSRAWAHLGWYVAIKKDGKPKPGPKTKWGQKAIQFLPRRRP